MGVRSDFSRPGASNRQPDDLACFSKRPAISYFIGSEVNLGDLAMLELEFPRPGHLKCVLILTPNYKETGEKRKGILI